MYSAILKAPKKPDDFVPLTALTQTCTGCRWRVDGVTCEAFPDGIPPAILLGVFDHHYHFEDVGYDDQGVTFSPEPI